MLYHQWSNKDWKQPLEGSKHTAVIIIVVVGITVVHSDAGVADGQLLPCIWVGRAADAVQLRAVIAVVAVALPGECDEWVADLLAGRWDIVTVNFRRGSKRKDAGSEEDVLGVHRQVVRMLWGVLE